MAFGAEGLNRSRHIIPVFFSLFDQLLNCFCSQLMKRSFQLIASFVVFRAVAPKPCPPVWYWIYTWGTSWAVIVRKTKCSEQTERSVLSRKTKRSFPRFPSPRKTPRISLGRFLFLIYYISDIQVELHTLVTIKQQFGAVYIVLIYVDVSKIQGSEPFPASVSYSASDSICSSFKRYYNAIQATPV